MAPKSSKPMGPVIMCSAQELRLSDNIVKSLGEGGGGCEM